MKKIRNWLRKFLQAAGIYNELQISPIKRVFALIPFIAGPVIALGPRLFGDSVGLKLIILSITIPLLVGLFGELRKLNDPDHPDITFDKMVLYICITVIIVLDLIFIFAL